jgi:DNA-binding SARP family transcriptional activator
MASPPLTLCLFGPLRITVRGAPLPRVRTRSVEWLLALLTLRHGRTVRRDWLAGTLWPDSSESRALQSLRDDLVRLRQALGAESGRILSPTRDQLTLDLDGAEVDVLAFDAAIARGLGVRGQGSGDGGHGSGDEASLREAVAVYTGPLLEGCVEEWVLLERETRAEQCLRALETLAERAEGRGEHDAAIGDLRRAAALDPLRDSVHQRLMANLAAAGDPTAAMEVYRTFRGRLHEELTASPDTETTALFQQIRAAARDRLREGGRSGVQAFGRSGVQDEEGRLILHPVLPARTPERPNA